MGDLQNAAAALRRRGLAVEVSETSCAIGKPVGLPGNSREYRHYMITGLDGQDIEIDTPFVHLFASGSGWNVSVGDYCPGPGPGDFNDHHESLDAAVEAVISYFFGPPQKMLPPDILAEMAAMAMTKEEQILWLSNPVVGSTCRDDNCERPTIEHSIYCGSHHVERLKKIGLLKGDPSSQQNAED